jgi:serine protease Do
VASDSDAGDKGLQRGDIIVRAGDQKTDSPAEVSAAVDAARHEGRKSVLLLVRHGEQRLFIPIEVTPPEKG